MRPLLLMLLAQLASAGSIVRNGADLYQDSQAWFLGHQPISACVEIDPQFPVPKADALLIFRDAIANWKRYLESKRLEKEWPKDVPFLNLNYRFSATCKGQEQLTIYLGQEPERVREVKRRFASPRAFANLETYDSKSGMGIGLIWIANYKSKDSSFLDLHGQLEAVFTHEIGHVLGCGHVAGTIMREDLMQFMANASPLDLAPQEVARYSKVIEHRRELYFSFDRGVSALLSVRSADSPEMATLFARLLGRGPSAPIVAGFVQGVGAQRFEGNLYIGDASGPVRDSSGQNKLKGAVFMIEFDEGTLVPISYSEHKLFNVIYKNQSHWKDVPSFLMQGRLLLKAPQTGEIPITYIRNRGDNEFVRLLYRSQDGSTKEFFRAFLFDQPFW